MRAATRGGRVRLGVVRVRTYAPLGAVDGVCDQAPLLFSNGAPRARCSRRRRAARVRARNAAPRRRSTAWPRIRPHSWLRSRGGGWGHRRHRARASGAQMRTTRSGVFTHILALQFPTYTPCHCLAFWPLRSLLTTGGHAPGVGKQWHGTRTARRCAAGTFSWAPARIR